MDSRLLLLISSLIITRVGQGYKASIDMKLPEISGTIELVSGGYLHSVHLGMRVMFATLANPENSDPNGGVCSNPKDQVGVDFDANLDLNLFASLDQENGGPNLLSVPIYVSLPLHSVFIPEFPSLSRRSQRF